MFQRPKPTTLLLMRRGASALFASILAGAGYATRTADNLQEAQLLLLGHPEIENVIMDTGDSQRNFAFARFALSRRRPPQVVVVSSDIDRDIRENSQLVGAMFRPDDLDHQGVLDLMALPVN